MIRRTPHILAWGTHRLELGRSTAIMGVVNVTPDSFSDGGHFFSIDAAVSQGRQLAADGAHILDIGGESTRPFSDPVSADEEVRRVVPVIKALAEQVAIPISIDTYKSEVAEQALAAGAAMVNDIGAMRLDARIGRVAAEFGVPIVLMHMLGTPKTMQQAPAYSDLTGDIGRFLEDAVHRAEAAGVPRSRVIVDPGIGFGKTLSHNLELLHRLGDLQHIGAPLLIGPSRKAFIRHLIKPAGADDISPLLPVVETGTQAAVAAAIFNGAHIVRVHDVASTRPTATIADAILNAETA